MWAIGGAVLIREWRVTTGPMQLEGELMADLGWSQITQTYSVPKAPEWWPNKLAQFEMAHQGHIATAASWPPPWPHVRLPLMGQPLVVRLERKRIYRRDRPELYAEIVLPETATQETPIVANAEIHGLKAGQEREVKALYAAAELLYLDPHAPVKRVGHQPNKPNAITTDSEEDLELAREWRKLKQAGLPWKSIAARASLDWRTVKRWVLWLESQETGT